MNRKGFSLSNKILYWTFLASMILIIVAGVTIGIIFSYNNSISATYPLYEDEIYKDRLLYSPNCFAYSDPSTARTYSFTIDLGRFSDATLNDCIPLEGLQSKALRVELQYFDEATAKYVVVSATTKNWETARSGQKFVSYSEPVLVRDGNANIVPGNMNFLYWY